MTFFVTAIDHVQLAMPAGAEEIAVAFYSGVLGIPRVPKPAVMAARGGCWFENGEVRIHLGIEADFRPAKKAHPGLRVRNFDALLTRLRVAEIPITMSDEIAGTRRGHIEDPFGNRIELIDDKAA
jgi:catechol 2,3-dioxygenase-like lactoylglutathione lyase family enzyme